MSKSGLFAHFGSKEELQLATVDQAATLFVDEVIVAARAAPKGLPRVWALCDHMIDYIGAPGVPRRLLLRGDLGRVQSSTRPRARPDRRR